VGNGTQEDKDVPDGVVVWAFVVGKEIGANSIEYALTEEEDQREGGELCPDSGEDEQHAPSHDEIHRQRELRMLAYCYNLDDGTHQCHEPQKAKDQPTQPTSNDTNTDGGVGAGYHDVDADVVALAEDILCHARTQPMVDGAGQEHQKHAHNEEEDTKGHLPTCTDCRPHHPDGREGKDNTY